MANERLQGLRRLMEENGIDIYYVPSSDFHDSEYPDRFFGCRRFLSGFTGSAGTVVVTRDFAGLWTDGRYFVQAKKELSGQEIRLMKMGAEDVPTIEEFIETHIPENGVLGFDGRVVNAAAGRRFERLLEKKQATLSVGLDLVGTLWLDRPVLEPPRLWLLEEHIAGESLMSKAKRLRMAMQKTGATAHILTSLDDVAWLFNIRKEADAAGNLLPPAYALITEESLRIFIDSRAVSEEIFAYFAKNGVRVEAYEAVYEAVKGLRSERILLEPEKVNFALQRGIDASNTIVEQRNPTSEMKAVKNPVEQENMRRAHVKDGVALWRFICWLKEQEDPITEAEAAVRLEEFRKEQEGYLCPSFGTISAYGANAAMCHYHAKKGQDAKIGREGFYLVDSGGQYLEGTTDVTRTIAMGPLSEEMRLHYTLVLMGHLRLSAARFLYGCPGQNLDILARSALWKYGLDFNHGTGHGVGFLSNVHERPNNIRWKQPQGGVPSCVLEEGMITSNEPGLYIEGSHGIRIETLLLCKKAKKNEYGQFMEFETLTFVPIDTEAIDSSVMEPSDIELLNAYHKEVYEKLSPYLAGRELEKLFEATRPIGL
ncbi:MAG: aminopeptidase P family protein [Lachnospiraceae bacterium]|nr:aminopeptidase P family protein [Lachnospiraceae bacterium]